RTAYRPPPLPDRPGTRRSRNRRRRRSRRSSRGLPFLRGGRRRGLRLLLRRGVLPTGRRLVLLRVGPGRALLGGLGMPLGLLPVVGRVEPGSLERDRRDREDLAEPAAAHGADRQRFVRHLLDDVERVATVAARVLVRGHLRRKSTDGPSPGSAVQGSD